MEKKDVVIIGGGAGGYFSAITCAELYPHLKVLLLEGTNRPLTKVRISGGGRCNVTHDCLDPAELVKNYPRGSKELRQVFHQFHVQHTIEWFKKKGVFLKVESDGRMFSVTNKSETIIQCLQEATLKAGVDVRCGHIVSELIKTEEGFLVKLRGKEPIECTNVLLATGSAPQGYSMAQSLGHSIVPIVPSLFTFKIEDPRLEGLAGLSVENAHVSLSFASSKKKFEQEGPLLITHWGLSGPAILKLSAWAARELYQSSYEAQLRIRWLPQEISSQLHDLLEHEKKSSSKKSLYSLTSLPLPKRLWVKLLENLGVDKDLTWAHLNKKLQSALIEELSRGLFLVKGKGEYKEEFVSCGGVDLKEVDFKTMQSRVCRGLFFSGEILNIDGVTGGFNFQNAWSTGWVAGKNLL